MKKITLLFVIFLVAIGASGAYAYNEGMLDELLGVEDDEEKDEQVSSSGTAPIARITPSNPKIQINETISFSGSDSTDADGDDLSLYGLLKEIQRIMKDQLSKGTILTKENIL